MQQESSIDYVHLFSSFSDSETKIMTDWLKTNSIPNLSQNDITNIGSWLSLIRKSYQKTEDKRYIKLDPNVISNSDFYRILMMELEIRTEKETVTETEINFLKNYFQFLITQTQYFSHQVYKHQLYNND